jgi:hypothetical protein
MSSMRRLFVTVLALLAVCAAHAASGLSSQLPPQTVQLQGQTAQQPCSAPCVQGGQAGETDPSNLGQPIPNAAENENAGDYGLVVLLAAVFLIALVIVTRQRAARRNAARADSPAALHVAFDQRDSGLDQP